MKHQEIDVACEGEVGIAADGEREKLVVAWVAANRDGGLNRRWNRKSFEVFNKLKTLFAWRVSVEFWPEENGTKFV